MIRTALALACVGAIATIASCATDDRLLRDAGVRPEGSADASALKQPTHALARATLQYFRFNALAVTSLPIKRGAVADEDQCVPNPQLFHGKCHDQT